MTSENKTTPNKHDVFDFLDTLEDVQQKRDSEILIAMMSKISGESPVMWGSAIIGFGTYHYKYASGREGDMPKIAFSPRKGKLSLYITYDASTYKKELDVMGKHGVGKGCIYIKQLSDVSVEKLRAIIQAGFEEPDPLV